MGQHDFALKLALSSFNFVPQLYVKHREVRYAKILFDLDIFHPWAFNVDFEVTLRTVVGFRAYQGVGEYFLS